MININMNKSLGKLKEAIKVPCEHMLKINKHSSAYWFLKKRVPVESKECNDKDGGFCYKENGNHI